MKLLVTGARGLVASRLLPLARARGHELVVQSRETHGELWAEGVAESLVEGVDVILHPGGLTDVDACERDPDEAFRANVLSTEKLARAARRTGAHLIYVSTDYVFDGAHGPYAEDAVPNPQGVYARSKHLAELTARTFCPNAAIARTATVCSWPPALKLNFGAWLIRSLSSGQRVKLFTDQLVSPSLASNVAEMLIDLAEQRGAGVWHLSGSDTLDRVSFGKKLCAAFGFDPALIDPVRMADGPISVLRPLRAGLKVERARTLGHPPLSVDQVIAGLRAEYLSSTAAGAGA